MSPKETAKRKLPEISSLRAVQEVEKELMRIPSKLAAQLVKGTDSLKKKESKLKKARVKNKNQIASVQKRIKMAEKKQQAKRLASAKKELKRTLKAEMDLDRSLEAMNASLETVSMEHAKLLALHKHLHQFEKEWTKAAKPSSKTKVKAKVKKRAKKMKSVPEISATRDLVDADRMVFDEITN